VVTSGVLAGVALGGSAMVVGVGTRLDGLSQPISSVSIINPSRTHRIALFVGKGRPGRSMLFPP